MVSGGRLTKENASSPGILGIYLTPDQARAMLEQASSRATVNGSPQDWAIRSRS